MTDEILKGLAAQCANMCKTEMRNRRKFSVLMAVWNEGEGLTRARDFEKTIAGIAGEQWLNSEAAKKAAFKVVRESLEKLPMDCFIFASIASVSKDFAEPETVLAVTAQTATRVCLYRQRLQGRLFVGEPAIVFVDQADFDGSMKVYGGEGETGKETVQ